MDVRMNPAELTGQDRIQQEIAELNRVKGPGEVTLGDLPDGYSVLIVPSPEPPGYLLYFKIGPDYPLEAPSLMAEKNGRQVALSSRTLTNWRPRNRLAEVVTELTGHANHMRALLLGGSFVLAAFFLIGLGVLMFLNGENRLEQSSSQGTAQAIATQLDKSNNRLNTAIAQATATVLADPKLGNAPNPTLTAAYYELVNIRNQNESALATVTAVARQNLTATADAVLTANAQTQAAYLQSLTATADAQAKLTAAAQAQLTAAAAQRLTAAAAQQLTAAARQQLTASAAYRLTAAALTKAAPPPVQPKPTQAPAPAQTPVPAPQPTQAPAQPQPTQPPPAQPTQAPAPTQPPAQPQPTPAPTPTPPPPPPPPPPNTTVPPIVGTVEQVVAPPVTPQPTPTQPDQGNNGQGKGPGPTKGGNK